VSAPEGLGKAGKTLWAEMHSALAEDWTFDERDLAILAAACHQADDIDTIEQALVGAAAFTPGSNGQLRLNQAFTELRGARLALARLLKDVEIAPADSRRTTSESARRAASERWQGRPSPIKRAHG
jgi:hypothetical protein